MKTFVALLGLLVVIGCSRQPVEMKLSAAEREAFTTSLAQLHVARPPAITPAPSAEELTALQGICRAEEVELWFKNTPAGAELLPGMRVIGITQALKQRKYVRWIPFIDPRRKHGVQLMDDGAGDGFFADFDRSPVRVFYHMLQSSDSFQDFGTMREFVAFLLKVQSSGAIKADQNNTQDSARIYDELETEYLRSLQKR